MLLLTLLLTTPAVDDLAITPLYDHREEARADAWRPLHDRVMGGVSSGSVRDVDEGVRFTGEVSLENNGGFASFRLETELPVLDGEDGLRLRVRGDGHVYKLALRTSGREGAVSWQAPFATTAGEWTTIDLPFDALQPTWRGRFVSDADALAPARVSELGLLIADGQVGAFQLELQQLAAWRAPGGDDPAPGSVAARQARTRALAALVEADAEPSALLSSLRGNERVLVLSSPDVLDAHTSRQRGRLLAAFDGLAARELRIVALMGERAGHLAGRALAPETIAALRAHWELPSDTPALTLVGKDGGVKARWTELVEPAEVFALVDAMPMRRAERELRGDG